MWVQKVIALQHLKLGLKEPAQHVLQLFILVSIGLGSSETGKRYLCGVF